MKTIVTHLSPDLDAITSCWLIKRFLPGWKDSRIKFVPAGSTLDEKQPDENPNIIHVDTGMGKFDHHQTQENTCAAILVYEYLNKKKLLKKNYQEALERLVNQVNFFDHFGEIKLKNPEKDVYNFLISSIIEGGLRNILKSDEELTYYIFSILDALLVVFLKKIQAEKDIKEGYVFQSKWGRSLVMSSKNEESLKLALKKGFKLVARKDPEKGNIRIKTPPYKKYNLGKLYEKIIKIDKKENWFFHASGNMLLNGSSKNPNLAPSKITLKQLIDIIKSI